MQRLQQRAPPASQPSVCVEAQPVRRARLSATPVVAWEGAGIASKLSHRMWLIKRVLETGQGACTRGMALHLQVGCPFPLLSGRLRLSSSALGCNRCQVSWATSPEAGTLQDQHACNTMQC